MKKSICLIFALTMLPIISLAQSFGLPKFDNIQDYQQYVGKQCRFYEDAPKNITKGVTYVITKISRWDKDAMTINFKRISPPENSWEKEKAMVVCYINSEGNSPSDLKLNLVDEFERYKQKQIGNQQIFRDKIYTLIDVIWARNEFNANYNYEPKFIFSNQIDTISIHPSNIPKFKRLDYQDYIIDNHDVVFARIINSKNELSALDIHKAAKMYFSYKYKAGGYEIEIDDKEEKSIVAKVNLSLLPKFSYIIVKIDSKDNRARVICTVKNMSSLFENYYNNSVSFMKLHSSITNQILAIFKDIEEFINDYKSTDW